MQLDFDPISVIIGILGVVVAFWGGKQMMKIVKQKIKTGNNYGKQTNQTISAENVTVINIEQLNRDSITDIARRIKEKTEVIVQSEDETKKQLEKNKSGIKEMFIKNEKLSLILAKALDFTKSTGDEQTSLWIERELYRDPMWISSDISTSEMRNVSDKSIFPEYRSISGKFYLQSQSGVEEFPLRQFIPFSIFQLESMLNDAESKSATQIVFHMPPLQEWVKRFPKIFSASKTISVYVDVSEIKKVMSEIRQRIHKYIYA